MNVRPLASSACLPWVALLVLGVAVLVLGLVALSGQAMAYPVARLGPTSDALNRETARRYTPGSSDAADAAQPTGRETDYDGNGRIVGQRQSSGEGEAVLSRRWDALGRLVEETDLDGLASTWHYDAVGNRRQRSDALGETGYQPDRLHRIAQIAAPGAAAISLSYSPAGRLQAIDHGGGTRSEYGYDAAGRLATLRHVQTGTEVERWAYAYDARGNRTQETEHTVDGERITTWRYDEDERLLGMTTPESDTAYVLDAVGNRIEEVVTDQASGQVTHRIQASFNERDQLIERSDAIGGERTEYTYDVHGNLATETTSGQTTEYRHNVEDRLATLSLQGAPPEQATHYAYGPDGLRIGKRDGSSATRYHYDQGQLRLESNVLGNPQVGYEYAAGHVLAQKTEASQRWLHYLHDAQRSPVRWIDESGVTDGTARYDAWGVKQAGAGNANSVGYTGYYADAESGQYYAQQRYYRQGIGRFLSVDPGPMLFERPITLNRYLYANGNPQLYVDPDGRIALLVSGADQLEDFRGWLAGQTATYQQGALGQIGGISGGVARGLVGAAEGALRGVNYVANVGSVVLADYGLNNEAWAAEHFRETQGTHTAALGAYDYVVHQGGAAELYQRGKDVLRRADAGEVQALGELTEFATGFVGGTGAARNTAQQAGRAGLRVAQEAEALAAAAAQRAKNTLEGAKRVLEGTDGTPAVTLERRLELLAENDFGGDQLIAASAEELASQIHPWTSTGERRSLAASIYNQAGWPAERVAAHLKGIDFDLPVNVENLPPGTRVIQYQLPGAPIGNYAAPLGTPAYGLGIYTSGRVKATLEMSQGVRVLRSFAAPIVDSWSWRPFEIHAPGGNPQYFVPDITRLTPVP